MPTEFRRACWRFSPIPLGQIDMGAFLAGLALALAAAFVLAVPVLRSYPTAIIAVYLFVGLLTPYWIGISASGQFLPVMLILTILALVLVAARTDRLRILDALLGLLVLVCGAAVVVGGSLPGDFVAVLGSWVAPYALGRMGALRIAAGSLSRIMLSLAAVLGLQSLAEFALNWHPFQALTSFPGPSAIWAPLQYRGGFARSEGAFGTAISLGNVLAMFLPYLVLGRLPRLAVVLMVPLVVAATAVTFSRNALVAIVVGLLMTIVFSHSTSDRPFRKLWLTYLLAGSVAILAPLYFSSLTDASTELANSTSYRTSYSEVLSDVRPLGLAKTYLQLGDGQSGFAAPGYPGGVVLSVDNTPLLVGLEFGAIPGVLLLIMLIFIFGILVKSRNNPSMVAAAAQIGTVLTLAMVTQYSYVFWMVLGFGVTYHYMQPREPVAARFHWRSLRSLIHRTSHPVGGRWSTSFSTGTEGETEAS